MTSFLTLLYSTQKQDGYSPDAEVLPDCQVQLSNHIYSVSTVHLSRGRYGMRNTTWKESQLDFAGGESGGRLTGNNCRECSCVCVCPTGGQAID